MIRRVFSLHYFNSSFYKRLMLFIKSFIKETIVTETPSTFHFLMIFMTNSDIRLVLS